MHGTMNLKLSKTCVGMKSYIHFSNYWKHNGDASPENYEWRYTSTPPTCLHSVEMQKI